MIFSLTVIKKLSGLGNFTAAKYAWIEEQDSKSYALTLIASLIFILCVLIVVVVVFIKRHYTPISNMKLIANVNPDYAGVQYKQDGWEVLREKIILLQELGQGSFGMVYEGIIKDIKIEGSETRCAVKTVNDNATDKERISFLNEASVMKQFDCAFVVKLLGVVSTSQPTFVVMELMANGDLKGYLRSHRPEYDSLYEHTVNPLTQPPTLRQILQMAAEVSLTFNFYV
jgi:insulin receptor